MLNYSGLKDRARKEALNGTFPPITHYPLYTIFEIMIFIEILQTTMSDYISTETVAQLYEKDGVVARSS